jgi:hypothetical protein
MHVTDGQSNCLQGQKKPSGSVSKIYLGAAIRHYLYKADRIPNEKEAFAQLEIVRELARRLRQNAGFSPWVPLSFAAAIAAAIVILLVTHTRHTYFYSYPDNYLRVVRNVDPCLPDGSCGYRFAMQAVTDGVAGEVTEMQFCKGLQSRFEAGHTLRWIRYANLGSCQAIDGYDILRDSSGPVLAPNCVKDYTTAPVAGHIACEGGVARF